MISFTQPWPQPKNFICRPSVAALSKNSYGPIQAPQPLPAKYVKEYEEFLLEKAALADEKEKLAKEITAVSSQLSATEAIGVNRWSKKEATAAAALKERLVKELKGLEERKKKLDAKAETLEKEKKTLLDLVEAFAVPKPSV